jgi:hypothetical protein
MTIGYRMLATTVVGAFLVVGCDLQPVSPLSVANVSKPVLLVLPGRAQVVGSTVGYESCVEIRNPSDGAEVSLPEVTFTVIGPDQSVYGSTDTSFFRLAPGETVSPCGFPRMSMPNTRPIATSYRISAAYKFYDGSSGELTGASTFNPVLR